MKNIPVLIVGAGPTGLTMACELERLGVTFRIIDKQIKPVTTSNALVAQTRTLEFWDDLGLLPNALSRGNKLTAANFYFDNKNHVRLSFDLIDSLYPFVLGIAQHETEMMLIEYLQQKNISIEFEVELIELYEEENASIASLRYLDGSIEKIKAQWVIACDGGHSLVRTKLNIAFPGKELEEHFVLADVKVESGLLQHELYGFLSEQGPLLIIQYNDEYSRIIAEVTRDPVLHAAKSLTREQIEKLIIERSLVPIKMGEPIWTSGFWIHEKIMDTYRHNTVFFAGDAAHIHSPAGGQGMNTGIQDAYNLAWKLALIIQKNANPDILSTYQIERQRIAKAVLKNSTILTHMVSLKNPFLRGLRNFALPLLLKSKKIRKKVVENLTEVAIQYPPGMLVQDCLENFSGQKAGMRMLDVRINENSCLLDYVRGTQFCLLIFSGVPQVIDEAICCQLNDKILQQFHGVIKVILVASQNSFSTWQGVQVPDPSAIIHAQYQVTGPCFYLIRPDKYIGFRGKLMHELDLMKYLSAIFDKQKENKNPSIP